jgi:hypothetical protein
MREEGDSKKLALRSKVTILFVAKPQVKLGRAEQAATRGAVKRVIEELVVRLILVWMDGVRGLLHKEAEERSLSPVAPRPGSPWHTHPSAAPK